MAKATLTIASKNYGSWSLRGWLLCKMAKLDFEEKHVGPTTLRRARNCCCCRRPSWCPASTMTGSRSGTRWRSPNTSTRSSPKRACCRPIRRSARTAARSAARCIPAFSNLRSALPMNLKAHFPGFKSGRARAPTSIASPRSGAIASRNTSGPYLFGTMPCAADAMYAPVCTRFLTYDVALDPSRRGYCRTIMAMPTCRNGSRPRRSSPTTRRTRRRVLTDRNGSQSHFDPARIGPVDDPAVAVRQRGDLRHLRIAQREIENRGIFRKPLDLAGARNDDDVLLHQKAQADLRGGLVVRGADTREHLVVAGIAARDRAIGDDRHAVLAAGRDHLRLVEERDGIRPDRRPAARSHAATPPRSAPR